MGLIQISSTNLHSQNKLIASLVLAIRMRSRGAARRSSIWKNYGTHSRVKAPILTIRREEKSGYQLCTWRRGKNRRNSLVSLLMNSLKGCWLNLQRRKQKPSRQLKARFRTSKLKIWEIFGIKLIKNHHQSMKVFKLNPSLYSRASHLKRTNL
jgi:hypothetical protein